MKEFLKTNRLLLRFFEETDLDDLFRLLSNPKVMTYLEPPFGKEKTKEFLFKYCLNDDPLLYALEYEEKFIGYVIYHTFEEDSMEIGWVLFPEYWSKGFASELTEKLIEVTKKQNKRCVFLRKKRIFAPLVRQTRRCRATRSRKSGKGCPRRRPCV